MVEDDLISSHRLLNLPRLTAVFLGAMVLVGASPARGQPDPEQRQALLISCDGLRPDAIEIADAPVMRQLIATGSYQATCLNEMPAVTLPNHTSMLTGQAVRRHGVYANSTIPGRVAATTIFDVARDAGLGVGFFAGKGKLAYLCEEDGVDVWRLTGDVDTLAAEVVAAVQTIDLHLIFVHFGEPDGAGHRHGWMSGAYLDQVSRVDAAIGRILDALETGDLFDETVVILTADHGGHCNTHFLDIGEDRFIPFIMNGPGIAAGRNLCRQVRVMDAAATALHVLGLPTESARDGQPVTEAWGDYIQPECTAPDVAFTVLCGTLPPLFAVPLAVLLPWPRRPGSRDGRWSLCRPTARW
jgi:hypothetical protein